jgi:PKD repeat protein
MKRSILVTLILITLSCSKEHCNFDCEISEIPVSKFEYSRFRCENASNSCVQFQNTSENTNEKSKFIWTFGDGESSDNENPVHEFSSYREFNVVLRVTNCKGESSYYSETINISFE